MGVLVKGKEGQILILTNEHVVENNILLEMDFIDKDGKLTKTKVKVLAKNKNKDIAVLEFGGDEKKLEWTKELSTLKIEEESSVKDKEKIAIIGHAFGFPYTVGIAEAKGIIKGQKVSNILLSYPDERFTALEFYENHTDEKSFASHFKGDMIPGMSGGPTIGLEQEGDPKLIGLNTGFTKLLNMGFSVTSDEIIAFLKKHDLYEK